MIAPLHVPSLTDWQASHCQLNYTNIAVVSIVNYSRNSYSEYEKEFGYDLYLLLEVLHYHVSPDVEFRG